MENDLPKRPPGWGARHTVVVLAFMGFAVSFSMRFNMSLAIVAMVNSTRSYRPKLGNLTIEFQGQSQNQSCPHLKELEDLRKLENPGSSGTNGEFNWNEAEQGFILGSFFWGYILTQLPGGILAQKFGGKWTFGIGLFVTAIFALLTPWAARTHKYLLVLARVVQGLGEGLTVPSFHVILSKWAPPQERSNLASIAHGGAQFGIASTMVVAGFIIQSNFLGGWPGVFYTIGVLAIGWFILWCIFMFDSPANHPRISKEELAYIEKSFGDQSSKVAVKTPWRQIFTSVPVWAIIIGHVGQNWGSYTLLAQLPTYMKTVLHFDIKQNSLVSALPFTALWISSFVMTKVADFLIQRKILRIVVVRKICQSVAHLGSAVALICASYSGCDRILTVTLLTIAVGITGGVYGGYLVNHVDIAANHAGVLMGITNTFSNLCGFAAPYAAGLIINENPSLERWQLVFFIAAGIYVFEVLVFNIFASADEQPWNRPIVKHESGGGKISTNGVVTVKNYETHL